MKIIAALLIVGIFNLILFTCEDCTAFQYQIIEINKTDNKLICTYKARARTNCAVWREHDEKIFQDTCGKYNMSQSLLKTYLDATYP